MGTQIKVMDIMWSFLNQVYYMYIALSLNVAIQKKKKIVVFVCKAVKQNTWNSSELNMSKINVSCFSMLQKLLTFKLYESNEIVISKFCCSIYCVLAHVCTLQASFPHQYYSVSNTVKRTNVTPQCRSFQLETDHFN